MHVFSMLLYQQFNIYNQSFSNIPRAMRALRNDTFYFALIEFHTSKNR